MLKSQSMYCCHCLFLLMFNVQFFGNKGAVMDPEQSRKGSPRVAKEARQPGTQLPTIRTVCRREERLNGQLKRTDKRALRSRVTGLSYLLTVMNDG
ncbi:hypothetical protein M758_UG124400 [Ceratodon purpureus]|nr:hypothetical protein M758_UG124400 [Ceratodon purpureus]